MTRLILIILTTMLTVLLTSACRSSNGSQPIQTIKHDHSRIQGPIENLRMLNQNLYSGSEPSDLIHYQQLADMGIKTIISVDAIAPNPQLADRFGIRIVHFPIGYDGISDERTTQLAQAISQLEHPIFIHCHHGTHRGPAALCVGAIGAGLITTHQAESFMTASGTSPNYPGLWDAARTATPLDDAAIQSTTDFPAHAPVPGFVDSMGQLDRLHDQLWDLADNDWQTPDEHPDLSASAISSRMYDMMRTMSTLPYMDEDGREMRQKMNESTELSLVLENQIQAGQHESALVTFKAFSKSCKDCHSQFRN